MLKVPVTEDRKEELHEMIRLEEVKIKAAQKVIQRCFNELHPDFPLFGCLFFVAIVGLVVAMALLVAEVWT